MPFCTGMSYYRLTTKDFCVYFLDRKDLYESILKAHLNIFFIMSFGYPVVMELLLLLKHLLLFTEEIWDFWDRAWRKFCLQCKHGIHSCLKSKKSIVFNHTSTKENVLKNPPLKKNKNCTVHNIKAGRTEHNHLSTLYSFRTFRFSCFFTH